MLKTLDVIVTEAAEQFEKRFNEKPTHYSYSTGRVNLIGEHIDYNDGFVMPMAIPLYTVVVGKPHDDSTRFEIYSTNVKSDESLLQFTSDEITKNGRPKWASYILGVLAFYPGKVLGFKAVVHSTVPLGGGLSSSASLETATYRFADQIALEKSNLNPIDVALLCQKAEHEYANVPCGIMDQFSCSLSKKDNAIILDCRDLSYQYLPINDPDIAVLVTNSNVKHELNNSEYADRRRVCHESAKLLGENSLRDVSLDKVNSTKEILEPVAYKRVKHVITEITRTQQAAEALKNADYSLFGKLMVESHLSLKNDYEVSCPELDQLVDLAVTCSNDVYGSRMTGGGFGGCTVTLVKQGSVLNVMEFIEKNYNGKATFYVCTAAEGSNVGNFS